MVLDIATQVSDFELHLALEKLERNNVSPGHDGYYRTALHGPTLSDHPGVTDIVLFGKLKIRVFQPYASQTQIDTWLYGPQKEPPPVVCWNCHQEVPHPELRMSPEGPFEICSCGARLGDPEPIATGFLQATQSRTKAMSIG